MQRELLVEFSCNSPTLYLIALLRALLIVRSFVLEWRVVATIYPLLPRSNPTLHRWTSLLSWPAIASWPVMSTRSISKTICASIIVQKTTSWTPVPRSRPQFLLRATVLQQLLILQQLPLRNPQKNREWPLELHTDWGLHWTSLCSNKPNSTQYIYSFQSTFTLCFPYFTLDP